MQLAYPLIKHRKISSRYGWRWLSFNGGKSKHDFHHGWDFAADLATPVYANADGIAMIGHDPHGFGNYILLTGVTEQGSLFNIFFAHMMNGLIVRNGQHILKGDLIGNVGSTGRSTGPHLHWEMRILKNRKFESIDPKLVLNKNIVLRHV